MRAAEAARLQSAINVTPLVDVVLVLLIVFMLVAPLSVGPQIELPRTAAPPGAEEHERQLVVAIDAAGGTWVDGIRADRDELARRVREAASAGAPRVVIHGDARLSFGTVRRAMLDVEAAGASELRLVTERATAGGV